MFDKIEGKEERDTLLQEKQISIIAQIYGILLEDIEIVHFSNGKEYFKFYYPQDKMIRMVENKVDGKKLMDQFQEIQQTLFYSNPNHNILNIYDVFDYQLRYQNVELSLLSIRDLKVISSNDCSLLNKLTVEKKKCVQILLKNIDFLDLEYIDLENAIAIDKTGRVLCVYYNHDVGKCELEVAEIYRIHDNNRLVQDIEDKSDIPEGEFDSFVEQMNLLDNIQDFFDNKRIKSLNTPMIRGKKINMIFALQAYQYPEIMERSGMSEYDKKIYHGIIVAIHKKLAKVNPEIKGKQYVLETNQNYSQVTLANPLVLSLLTGFFGGMMLVVAFHLMKNIF